MRPGYTPTPMKLRSQRSSGSRTNRGRLRSRTSKRRPDQDTTRDKQRSPGLTGAPALGNEDGVIPREKSPGKPTTRGAPMRRPIRRSGWTRRLRRELGTSQGTVKRVAKQLGYRVESVPTWVREHDVADGVVGPRHPFRRVCATESPWDGWRLLTLETRMESCHTKCRLGSRLRVDIQRLRRTGRCARCVSSARSWAPSTAP